MITTDSDSECSYANLADFNVIRVIIIVIQIIVIRVLIIIIPTIYIIVIIIIIVIKFEKKFTEIESQITECTM